MVFVFDLDDTVCDTNGYSEKYILDFFAKNNLPFKQVQKITRFAETKFDWDLQTALDWYKTHGDQMMLEFPCRPNAVEVINKLHDEGNTIVIATARGFDWHADPEGITKKWLENIGLKYDKIYFGRVDKELICEEVGADIFMDDDVEIATRVANHFSKIGSHSKQAFLCVTDFNQDIPVQNNLWKIRDFNDFYDAVKNEIAQHK